jgi:hypothetical protein
MESKVYLGIPTHDRRLDQSTAWATHTTGLELGKTLGLAIKARSLLCVNFNELLCEAINAKTYTHFCLLHADIGPLQDGWMARMLEIMKERKVDVLSVVSPIKDDERRTSCSLGSEGGVKALYFKDLEGLPLTFGRKECEEKFGNKNLFFNTGCLMIRLKDLDPTKLLFQMVDNISNVDGHYCVANLPEDWLFSQKCMQNAVSYAVTTEIEIEHVGGGVWGNQV